MLQILAGQPKRIRYTLKRGIALDMAVGVIDSLEFICVDHKQIQWNVIIAPLPLFVLES